MKITKEQVQLIVSMLTEESSVSIRTVIQIINILNALEAIPEEKTK